MGAGSFETLAQLQAILSYHVLAGRVMAADVVGLSSAKTVNGAEVTIVVEDGKVILDGAMVIKTDIETSNGVIHVIDSVLLPPNEEQTTLCHAQRISSKERGRRISSAAISFRKV